MNLKEKILELIKNNQAEFFTAKQLCGILQTKSTAERRIVADVLQQMEKDFDVIFDEKNRRYRLVKEGDFGKAVFDANARGFGFLLMEEGDDLFVPAAKTHGAFHRDTVLYRKVEGTKDEAEIVKIISRGMTEVVGTYEKANHTRFVVPDDSKFISDIYVLPKRDLGAKNGQKVVVKVVHFPEDNRNSPEGEIVQVLGFPDEKNVDMLSVAYAFGLHKEFPEQTEIQAAKLPQTISESELKNRKDLRNDTVFTIDGEEAKDLDDAVSVKENSDGTYTLGVHIADVSHYVKPSDDVDKEAFARGTSVYFPQTVFPMLPTALSNGICSLYEGVDRLTLTCQMVIDTSGKVLESDVFPSVIRSCHRLTYTAVQAIFDGDKKTQKQFADIVPDLSVMKKLAEILQKKREKRGNVDFQTKEVQFVHDEQGNVVDVVPLKRLFAHQLIEEFMIVANESVAEYAENCQYPFVYRVHEKPDQEKYANLMALVKGVGIKVKQTKEIHNSVLQDALKKAESTPYFNLINDVMLRTMQKAKYSPINSGHFGLSSNCYCHFTSPIRRYPDLVVHRILKTALDGKMTEKALHAYEDMADSAAFQSNLREKVADEAERKADDVKKCCYAERILGQSFEAIVSGVSERGIFCQLPNTVEGFVSVEKLDGYFQYDAAKFCLYNESLKFALGDKVFITVANVNKQTAKIEFDLAKAPCG